MNPIFCFDIDGTLISTGGAGGRAMRKAARRQFQKDPAWESISMAGRLDPSIYRQILSHLGEEFSLDLWNEFQFLYLNFLEEEVKDLRNWRILDGVHEALQALTNRRLPRILITGNIRQGAWLKLRSLQLHHFFDWDASVFGEDGKEKRDELADAYRKKNSPSFLPVVIGDTPDDIRVGRLAGGVAVAVSTGVHSQEELASHTPDYNLKSLQEFPWNSFGL